MDIVNCPFKRSSLLIREATFKLSDVWFFVPERVNSVQATLGFVGKIIHKAGCYVILSRDKLPPSSSLLCVLYLKLGYTIKTTADFCRITKKNSHSVNELEYVCDRFHRINVIFLEKKLNVH